MCILAYGVAMATDWLDISYHTAPAVAVSIAMGFMAATGLQVMGPPLSYIFAFVALDAAVAFSWIWTPREKFQHGGKLGGTQSHLEAFVPLVAGILSFCLAFVAFWYFPV